MRRADAKSFSKCLAVCLAVVFLNGCISGQPSMLTRGSTTAEKQGLLIADSDVDQYIVTMKEYAKNDNSPELTLIREYASGRGLTLDEYFNSIKPLYKKLMSIGNLRSKYVAGSTSFTEETAKWQQVKTQLVKGYQSQIHIVE